MDSVEVVTSKGRQGGNRRQGVHLIPTRNQRKQPVHHLDKVSVLERFLDIGIATRIDQCRVAGRATKEDDRMDLAALGTLDLPADVESVQGRD
jgi:hypothetical protein